MAEVIDVALRGDEQVATAAWLGGDAYHRGGEGAAYGAEPGGPEVQHLAILLDQPVAPLRIDGDAGHRGRESDALASG